MTGMDFTSAGKGVRRLLAAPKRPKDLSTSSLTEDELRDNIVREEIQHSGRFKSAMNHMPEIEVEVEDEDGNKHTESHTWGEYPEAMRDAARALFGFDEPEIRDPHEVRPSHQLNREIMANAIHDEAFKEARPFTRGNSLESLYGAMQFSNKLHEHAETTLAEHIKRAKEMGEQEQSAQSAQEMIDKLRQQAKKQHDAAGQIDPNLVQKMKQQVAARQAARAALQQLIQQQAQSNMVIDAATAASAAAQAAADAVEALGTLPGVGGGQAHNLSPDQQIALAEKWSENPTLREIARMVGRLIRDMRFKRSARTKNVKIEPVGITTGRDVDIMLPTELAQAHMETLRPLFLKRFAEHSLLQYEMAGRAPAGKGPIIEVHDGSGSMSGEPFIWASSVALALMSIAVREKRPFAGIEFGSANQLKDWYFPKGKTPDPDMVLDFASHFFGGGTSIVTGMRRALKIIQDEPAFKSADVVLISDGQDYFRDEDLEIREKLKLLGVRIHGISILTGDNAYMSQMCDWSLDVTDLAGANDATDKLAENIT